MSPVQQLEFEEFWRADAARWAAAHRALTRARSAASELAAFADAQGQHYEARRARAFADALATPAHAAAEARSAARRRGGRHVRRST